jgi:hypothetical protein
MNIVGPPAIVLDRSCMGIVYVCPRRAAVATMLLLSLSPGGCATATGVRL